MTTEARGTGEGTGGPDAPAGVSAAEADALVALVRRVGQQIILPRFRRLAPGEIETKSDPSDLVTIADREAEAALAAGARDILPGCAVVGEEAVAEDPTLLGTIAGSETCVILDPVDGTFNFARGLAVFGVILAVTRQGQTVFGLLYDPVLDDWVMAHRGGGAEHVAATGTRRRLSVRRGVEIPQAEGMVPLDLYGGARRTRLMGAFEAVRSVRSLRCSCHEYRMLAMGQADFVVNGSLNPWDHAAGVLVLEEAGGCVLVDGTSSYRPTMRTGRLTAATGKELTATLAAVEW
ncbi:inositol monophosphatase family protein [Oceanicola sp. S124]|uniref:inositol monophosphatase family protein n=1 Tax=Oceanicola sp. S124 TaxID=1042378 RepID=UPI000A041C7C|nr:inositol monophosphatase [Oceanicola sp. S124]